MEEFRYLEPRSLRRACRLLNQYQGEAKVIAGGVSLIVLMKNRLLRPAILVNIKSVQGLDNIKFHPRSGLRVGPLTLHRQVAAHPIVRERFSLLAAAASEVGSSAIRNMGTIGGNLCHADPSGDIAPALLCLDARLQLVSLRGKKVVSVDEFCTDYYTTLLEPDEILAEIQIPTPPHGSGGAYLKLKRTATDMAIVQVAACVSRNPKMGICTGARIAFGSLGPRPIFAQEACEYLKGKGLSPEEIEHGADLAAAQVEPSGDGRGSAEYKKEMARIHVKRALKLAWERAGGRDWRDARGASAQR
jgi:carbon-monoxide dehydrogenase medium subunit